MTTPSSEQRELNGGTVDDSPLESLSFDEILDRLEEVVQQLETDQLSLDESIETFERGVRLAARCQQLLENAELRISRITNQLGETEPYAPFGQNGDDVEDEEP